MKVSFIILSAAVFYFHVARGLPTDAKKDKPAEVQAAPAAPVAEKPETCTANIDGTSQTLKTGDRYCLDDKTHRVCNYGEWIDNPCPEDSKCLKSPTQWQVLCRIVRKNPPQSAPPQDSDVQPSAAKSPEASNPAPAPKQEKPQVDSVPPPAPAPKEEKPQPEAPKEEKPQPPQPQPEAPKQEKPQVDQPKPVDTPKSVEPAATSPAKPETCKATIDGQEQTLQPGDRYCLNDNTNRVCNWGEFVDYECPNNSKCLKSPDKWQVLCRIVNKNPAQNAPGADGH